MKKELRKYGFIMNKKKVQRLMRELDIRVTAFTRKSRKYSSYKGNIGKVAPNLVNRRFDSSIPHQKITTDTIEFKYYETEQSGNIQNKKIYLDPFLDMFNREIVSFSLSKQPNGETIMSVWKKPLKPLTAVNLDVLFIPTKDGRIK